MVAAHHHLNTTPSKTSQIASRIIKNGSDRAMSWSHINAWGYSNNQLRLSCKKLVEFSRKSSCNWFQQRDFFLLLQGNELALLSLGKMDFMTFDKELQWTEAGHQFFLQVTCGKRHRLPPPFLFFSWPVQHLMIAKKSIKETETFLIASGARWVLDTNPIFFHVDHHHNTSASDKTHNFVWSLKAFR